MESSHAKHMSKTLYLLSIQHVIMIIQSIVFCKNIWLSAEPNRKHPDERHENILNFLFDERKREKRSSVERCMPYNRKMIDMNAKMPILVLASETGSRVGLRRLIVLKQAIMVQFRTNLVTGGHRINTWPFS